MTKTASTSTPTHCDNCGRRTGKLENILQEWLCDRCQAPMPPEQNSGIEVLEWLATPVTASGAPPTYLWDQWVTKCGRYRVSSVKSRYDPYEKPEFYACYLTTQQTWWPVEADKMGPGYPVKYATLGEAMQAILTYHKKTSGKVVETNAQTFVAPVFNPLPKLKPVGSVAPTAGTGTRARMMVLGLPATAIVRWMGHQGWDRNKARAALDKLQVPVADGTLYCQLRDGAKGGGTYGAVPTLTPEQVQQLNSLV